MINHEFFPDHFFADCDFLKEYSKHATPEKVELQGPFDETIIPMESLQLQIIA